MEATGKKKLRIVPAKGGRRVKPSIQKRNPIPVEILENVELNQFISTLPSNYNFEIHKSVYRIQQLKCKVVALQMPEGLLVYATLISDILEKFCQVETMIIGDVTYGACCVDDFTAQTLGADLLIHYGHSCLVPIQKCLMPILYVFVDIKIDVGHVIDMIRHNIPSDRRIGLIGTIQFTSCLPIIQQHIKAEYPQVIIPQESPLSQGEILGCTSPKLNQDDMDLLVYVGDGRFHLESIMISNPTIPTYQYDPYSKKFTLEGLDDAKMKADRLEAIEKARQCQQWGIILGTLGRQGDVELLHRVTDLLTEKGKEVTVVLLSEIFPQKLAQMDRIQVWVQIACPRLSIDWGYSFPKPLLNTYETYVAMNEVEWKKVYPMDYYADDGGKWSSRYKS